MPVLSGILLVAEIELRFPGMAECRICLDRFPGQKDGLGRTSDGFFDALWRARVSRGAAEASAI